MQQENGHQGSGGPAISPGQDALARGAVLVSVLQGYPRRSTILGLSLELNVILNLARFDVVERAVVGLVGEDLLRCCGATVVPTSTGLWCHPGHL
jgi:hypothetical protein